MKKEIEWFEMEDGTRRYVRDIPKDELKELLENNGFKLNEDGSIQIRENNS